MWLPPTWSRRSGLRGVRAKLSGAVLSASLTSSRGMRTSPVSSSTAAPARRSRSRARAPMNSTPVSCSSRSAASWIASIWSWLSGSIGLKLLRIGAAPSGLAPIRWPSRWRRCRLGLRAPLMLLVLREQVGPERKSAKRSKGRYALCVSVPLWSSSHRSSLPQLLALGVVEGGGGETGGAPLAQHLHLIGGAVLEQRGLDIAQRQASAEAVAVAPRGDVARQGSVAIDRLAAEAVGAVGLDREARHALPRRLGRLGRGRLADEVPLVQPHEAAEAGFGRVVVGG